MRMNKKNHAAAARKPAGKKKDRTAGNDFKKNPFINLKEDPERNRPEENRTKQTERKEAEQIAEMIGSVLEGIFGGNKDGGMHPMVGVIELDPEDMLSMEIRDLEDQTEKYRREIAEKRRKLIGKSREISGRIWEQKEKEPAMPHWDGCGEEVFLEMLMDLNFMAEMILEADHGQGDQAETEDQVQRQNVESRRDHGKMG